MRLSEVLDHTKLKHGEEQWMLSTRAKALVSFMKTHCSDIIKIYNNDCKNGDFLFRGIIDAKSYILLGKSRDDRKPMDTSMAVQQIVDSSLAASGFKALRSNSIFCTGNLFAAENYGDLFIIFPVNGFSYTWSPKVRDLFDEVSLFDINKPNFNFAEQYKYKNSVGLADAIRMGYEILISGSYVALDYNQHDRIIDILTALGLE